VARYLTGVRREVATRFDAAQNHFRPRGGGAPSAAPASKQFWVSHSLGSGTQTLSWSPANGAYRIVVMNADASADIRANIAVGARFPHLLWIGIGVLGTGGLLLLLGGGGLYAAVRRRR
jgi:hypothetical protein